MARYDDLSDEQLEALIVRTKARGQEQSEYKAPKESSPWKAAGSGAVHGGTFGFAPKIIGGAGAAVLPYIRPDLFGDTTYGERYKELRDTAREQDRELAQSNPYAHFGGAVGGSIAPITRLGHLAMKVGATKLLPTGSYKGAAAIGAGFGGLQAAGESDRGELGGFGSENLSDVATGAGLGALIGPAMQFGLNNVAPKINVAGQAALEKAKEFQRMGLPFTKAQVTGKPEDIAREVAGSTGQYGYSNQQLVQAQKEAQRDAYIRKANELQTQIGGEPFIEKGAHASEAISTLTEKAAQSKANMDAKFAEARKLNAPLAHKDFKHLPDQLAEKLRQEGIGPRAAPQAYGLLSDLANEFKVKNNPRSLNSQTTKTQSTTIKEPNVATKNSLSISPTKRTQINEVRTKERGGAASLEELFDDAVGAKLDVTRPKISNTVNNKTVSPNLKNTTLNDIDVWRKGLNVVYRGADANSPERAAINIIRREVDSHLSNVIDRDLTNAVQKEIAAGNYKALKQRKEANEIAHNHYKQFRSQGDEDYGGAYIEDMIKNKSNYTNEMIVNDIYGASEFGFKPESAKIVERLKNDLAPEDFNKIKLEAVNKILGPIFKGNKIDVNAYNNNLQKTLRQHPTLMKTLFTPEERAGLKQLGSIGEEAFRPMKNVTPSKLTTSMTEKVIDFLASKPPLLKHITKPAWELIKELKNRPQVDEHSIINAIKKENVVPRGLPAAAVSAQNATISNAGEKQKGVSGKLPIFDEEIGMEALDSSEDKYSDLSDEQLEMLIERNKQLEGDGEDDNANLLKKMAYVESGNNPNARSRTSSASGLLQFTDGTWRDAVKRYGQETGITLRDKNNPKAQRAMTQLMLRDNGRDLQEFLGRKPNDTELYLTHFLGLGGAKKLLRSRGSNQPAARLLPAAAKANRSIFFKGRRPRTVDEVYQVISQKI